MKNILIFSDGTSENSKGGDDKIFSNVTKIADAVVKDSSQIVKYDEGIGSSGFILNQAIAQGIGYGLRRNVIELYEFLCANYTEGDEVYLFGFSRGAFTVRSLGGMISAFGLVQPTASNMLIISELYRLPPDSRENHPWWTDYKALDSRRIRIKFIGVFDTVSSLGIPYISNALNKTKTFYTGFHDTYLRNVDYAYHALALDEYRKTFTPNIWTKADDPELKEIKQCWFTGSHTDVGGGYLNSDLSNLSLYWMYQKAQNCGVRFHKLVEQGIPTGNINNSMNIFYSLLGKQYRNVGGIIDSIENKYTTVGECVHQSVLHRHNVSNRNILNFNGHTEAIKLAVEND